MAFQRSYSKVWWGNLQETSSLYNNNYNYHNPYEYGNRNRNGLYSINDDESHNLKLKSSENLSSIIETEENSPSSKSWNSNHHDSPGSLKSQDSGFSDNEELLTNVNNLKISSPTKSEKSETVSVSTIETPPTVIRRKKNINLNNSDSCSGSSSSSNKITIHNNYENYRISFSAPSSPISLIKNHEFYTKIDKINLNCSNQNDNNMHNDVNETNTPVSVTNTKVTSSIKRRKGVNQKVRRNILLQTSTNTDTDNSINFKNYNNETVYIGGNGIVKFIDKNNDDMIDIVENDINHENDSMNLSLSPKLSYSKRKGNLNNDNNNNENRIDFVTNTSTPKNLKGNILSSTTYTSSSASLTSLLPLPLPLPSPSFSKRSNISEYNNIPEINDTNMRSLYNFDYQNSNLNNNSLSVKYWLNDIRSSYCHEVMSTLQTKSIIHEAFKNMELNTTIIGKIIRQLQTKAIILQNEFDRVEKILNGDTKTDYSLYDAINNSKELVENAMNFVKILERRNVFFSTDIIKSNGIATSITSSATIAKKNNKKFHDNIEHMKLLMNDLKISLDKLHYLDLQSLIDDIQLLKRYIMITIQMIFEKLINIIIVNIENAKCDLMLRAHINMISTLSNMDYYGFSSLNNAFNKNEIVRVLLLICIENKLSSVRALTLRSLSTICSSNESIKQLCNAGGIEIIKDIIACDIKNNSINRTEPEKREAISLLTQITAPWHGNEHKVFGLKDYVESIVEGLTDIIVKTNCCQTLLLCAASLNNLSRLEVTSIYSIMSNETVLKLKDVIEGRGPGISIFLCEQIVSMLQNMSINKRCYSHLSNIDIINFLMYIFNIKFNEKFNARAENDSKYRTINIILYIFKRFIQESIINYDTIENLLIPIFKKIERNLNNSLTNNNNNNNNNDLNNYKYIEEYYKNITILNQQMNDSLLHRSFNRSNSSRSSNNHNNSSKLTSNLNSNNNELKTSKKIHESYV